MREATGTVHGKKGASSKLNFLLPEIPHRIAAMSYVIPNYNLRKPYLDA